MQAPAAVAGYQALDAMREALADRRHQRRKARLLPFDAALTRVGADGDKAMQAMVTTRATTTAGVILKMRSSSKSPPAKASSERA
jgi:hypothetical protein